MIRREIQLPDQSPQWLLISQIEHARISHRLAEHCLSYIHDAVQEHLLQAILHHDDGWAEWEQQPQLDAELGCPLSFRELPLEVSLPIWTKSIEAASQSGPLAAWVVSGHFLALLTASNKPMPLDKQALAWQEKITSQQTKWFSRWQALNPDLHDQSLAETALHWLQLLDMTSLWLCSACPTQGEANAAPKEDYHFATGEPHATTFSCDQKRASMNPWKFDSPTLEISANGWLVPARHYTSTEELLASRVEHTVRWQFVKAV